MNVEILDEGLLLRPWRTEDAEAVYRACQDPDIQRWTTVPSPYLPEHAAGFVTAIAPAAWADGTRAPFAVCDAATGEVLASCGLVTIDRAQRWSEVGYWTAPWARGRGVAVRATRAVARWAFQTLGMRRIVWQAKVGNHASRLVALRAGFTVNGRLPLADPHPLGGGDGWIGALLPADLDKEVTEGKFGSGSLEARRAAVFGGEQPVLFTAVRGEALRLRRPEARDIDAVAPHARDRGYCPAALAAVCAWAFTTLDLTRIEWRANVGNVASRRAAEKAGFVFEGTARGALDHRGKRIDAWVGALLAEDRGPQP